MTPVKCPICEKVVENADYLYSDFLYCSQKCLDEDNPD